MKALFVTIFYLYTSMHAIGQDADTKTMVDSLQYLSTDTLDCSAGLYWRIIAKGHRAIPFLIDKLTDTAHTNIKFHCKKTRLNVGEIAQFALTQIADFPTFLVTEIQFDVIIIDGTGEGCWSFYDFFFDNSNKQKYQERIKKWYNKERSKYKAQKILKNEQTVCQKKYGIDTYYRWIQ
jgi:hypothetical protein